MKTDILDFLARKVSPYILLFGMYLITHGHLSPGGGFQGGVVLASGIVLLLLCRGSEETETFFPSHYLSLIEAAGLYIFIGLGLTGILAGTYFLGPAPLTRWFTNAGFVFTLNVLIGLKVGAGMSLICCYLFQE